MNRIEAQAGTAFLLGQGEDLRVTAPLGTQVADLFCFSLVRPLDALSSGKSIDYNETIHFTKGHTLFSRAGRPLLDITEDTSAKHDFLVAPCTLQMFQMLAKNEAYHPSCEENLAQAFARFGLPREMMFTTFNIFMNYEVGAMGKLALQSPLNQAEDYIKFRAREDLIVGLTACSDPATNGGTCKPIDYSLNPQT